MIYFIKKVLNYNPNDPKRKQDRIEGKGGRERQEGKGTVAEDDSNVFYSTSYYTKLYDLKDLGVIDGTVCPVGQRTHT